MNLLRYQFGSTNTAPEWFVPYRARQALWQNFGIPFIDPSLEDLISCIVFVGSETQRQIHLQEQARIEAEQNGRH